MGFDPWTLWVIVGLVGLFSAGATLLAWLLGGRERYLGEWGVSSLFLALGVDGLILRNTAPALVSVLLANAALLFGFGLQWAALRSFAGKVWRGWWLAGLPVLWCGLCLLPAFSDSAASRIALFAVFAGVLNVAAMREIWRAEIPVPGLRWGLLGVCGALLVLNLGRLPLLMLMAPQGRDISIMSAEAALFGLISMGLIVLASFMMVFLVGEPAMRALRQEMWRDELTGLANRRGFIEAAQKCCARGGALALLMMDLDHLKQINDRYGHAAGDRVLALFGEILRRNSFAGALAGRLGGEEFAVLLPGVDREGAQAAAERLRQAFREASTHIAHGAGVPSFLATVSVGIATGAAAPACDEEEAQRRLERLCAQADAALYRAKQQGRDRVEMREAII
ncbi:GGDEF domain-containing protein [Ancylobacter radicis]|uniref:diguanylate cyclase n=1 Tax=Ancylobacter radicis TaxID=2836179 RepID=A0ABS5R2J2_9HYPH|nr:GGDEF domain-containing protein [Ancylobacter radicis]MBS9475717.1 GGDEF domain-containing protein [Ancylobacter radicis]